MRFARLIALVAAAMLVLAGCSPPGGDTSATTAGQVASNRAVSLGFEDIVVEQQDWAAIAGRLDAAGVTEVHLAVGRADWTAFPWSAQSDAESSLVRDTGRDFIAEAIAAIGTAGDGTKRRIVLTVDAFVPGWIAQDNEVAGIDTHGEHSEDFASAAALRNEPVGERLAALVAEVSTRYQPDAVTLTELMFDDHTFGVDDHDLYVDMTGERDWPRLPDGEIDAESPRIAQWRSQVVADTMARIAPGARDAGVRIEVDVRANFDDPAAGRPESGHDYELLLDQVDGLIVWAYFSLADRGPDALEPFVRSLAEAGLPLDRMTISIGLWASGDDFGAVDGTISPETMIAAIAGAEAGGAASVSVTPYSRFTEAHWSQLAAHWG
ncbi:hypothetical protein EG850_06680 [Gulosibacter macacae]|uniref:Glycosyl hydrolase-like 10 domain-containing protein n=1 Tax=Gulosibacter macacae TaxID=2488791 RepID=A0A3P3W1F4_9MICO|nr:hypothetical protein [Gulosibacter macacae]RRJ86703.1 hypothetical protein EG850_06680 [Gulosibacter macacae]